MPKEMSLGAPTLRVRDLNESLTFYEQGLGLMDKRKYTDDEGFEVHELGPHAAGGSDGPLLVLKSDPSATLPPPDFAGLYHYAVLVPTRKSLAATYLAVGNSGVAYDGFADHYVSEALYLHDVEQNGIEIYADRSQETWKKFFMQPMGDRALEIQRFGSLNKPLDFNSLLGELTKDGRAHPAPFAEGARIGHMHLRVTDLERSVKFYHEMLGFDIVTHYPELGAAFLSVGGYHHHLGLNTWNSRDGSKHEQGDAGLDRLTILLPGEESLDKLEASLKRGPVKRVERKRSHQLRASDPDGIEVEFRVNLPSIP